MTKSSDLTGMTFGRFLVVGRADNSKSGKTRWSCKCSCGSDVDVLADSLKSGKSQSCGCYGREAAAFANTTHGNGSWKEGRKTRSYGIWAAMLSRCRNPKNIGFPNYGGRGISVCERWKDYANFLSDMGEPEAGLTIERNNTDGNYEPSNCRWATHKEQARNTRRNVKVMVDGTEMFITDAYPITGIKQRSVWNVSKKLGCSTADAFAVVMSRRATSITQLTK